MSPRTLLSRVRTLRRAVVLVALLAALAAGGAGLAATLGSTPPPSRAAQAHTIEAGLRCPVCQGLSVADSPSTVAAGMRRIVVAQLAAGRTPAQVRGYFTARYGSWILLDTPRRGIGWLVWLLPLAGLLAGGGAIVWLLRRRGPAAPVPEPLPETVRARVEELYADHEQGQDSGDEELDAALALLAAIREDPASEPGAEAFALHRVAAAAPALVGAAAGARTTAALLGAATERAATGGPATQAAAAEGAAITVAGAGAAGAPGAAGVAGVAAADAGAGRGPGSGDASADAGAGVGSAIGDASADAGARQDPGASGETAEAATPASRFIRRRPRGLRLALMSAGVVFVLAVGLLLGTAVRPRPSGAPPTGDAKLVTDLVALRADAKAHPHQESAWIALGLAEDASGNLALAYQEYQHAAAVAPHDLEAKLLLGSVLIRGGSPAEAVKLLAPLLPAHPSDANLLLTLGVAEHDAHQPAAVATLKRFLQVAPNSPRAPQVRALLAK